MEHPSPRGVAALAAAALFAGFSGTAVSGADTVSLAVSAPILPAKKPTGALHCPRPRRRRRPRGPAPPAARAPADAVAPLPRRRPRRWSAAPCSPAGSRAGDTSVRFCIGVVPLLMAGATVRRRRAARSEPSAIGGGAGRVTAGSCGVLGGCTTLVGRRLRPRHAAAPVPGRSPQARLPVHLGPVVPRGRSTPPRCCSVSDPGASTAVACCWTPCPSCACSPGAPVRPDVRRPARSAPVRAAGDRGDRAGRGPPARTANRDAGFRLPWRARDRTGSQPVPAGCAGARP